MRSKAAGCTLLLALLTTAGCRTAVAPLPTVAWANESEARSVLADRRDGVRTVQARCALRWVPANGERDVATLDGALVMRGDEALRLRTWKVGQTVFDLTVVGDQTWVSASGEARRRAPADFEARLAELGGELRGLLRGPDFAEAEFVSSGDGLRATWPFGEATIDGRTLTPERFVLDEVADDGELRRVVIETVYAEYDGGLWYRRVTAEGAFGRVEIDFRDVEVNGTLNPRAFRPPRRAQLIDGAGAG